MAARLDRLKLYDTEPFVERRRGTRRRAAANRVSILSLNGEEVTVDLADVSLYGCAIRSDAEWLRVGGFISIGIGGKPWVQAIVRWIRNGQAGMEFIRPLPAERSEWHALIRG